MNTEVNLKSLFKWLGIGLVDTYLTLTFASFVTDSWNITQDGGTKLLVVIGLLLGLFLVGYLLNKLIISIYFSLCKLSEKISGNKKLKIDNTDDFLKLSLALFVILLSTMLVIGFIWLII